MAENAIIFLDYDKISDTLIYFSQEITLRFNVQLGRKDKDGKRKFFHRETAYESKYSNVGPVASIKREMNFFFSIDDSRDYLNNIMIGIQDVFLLRILMEKNIIPWFIGNKNIFGLSPDDGKLIITGEWKLQQFTLTDYKYLQFEPIILDYEDGKSGYGIRMTVNHPENFVDIDLNRFMAFYYIISNTDMYSAANSMVCYVKQEPYGINMYNMLGEGRTIGNQKVNNGKSFFDKL